MAMGIRLIHIKGIMHLTRGVMGGEIQGAKIMLVILNIRSMVQDKPLAGKQGHNIIQRAAERVATTQAHSDGGQGHVKGLGFDLLLQGVVFQNLRPMGQGIFDNQLNSINLLARRAFVLWGKVPQGRKDSR
jgi:hypothetical protein